MMPLISILMAARKAEATILAAIHSILAQSHEHWELIIASDCGANYLALCKDNGIMDGRLRMVTTSKPHSGPSAARNVALAAARGELITILDSDDTWLPGKLSVLEELAEQSGLACDNTRAVMPDGTVIGTAHDKSSLPRKIGTLDMINSGVPHFPMFGRELAGSGYREDLSFAEDVVFNIELITRAGAMTMSARSLTNYIQNPDSATNAPDAWLRADIAYGQILVMLQANELSVQPGEAEPIAAAIAAKRHLNREYGQTVASYGPMSFQAFLAARKFDAKQPDE